jgi:hypothetical protein
MDGTHATGTDALLFRGWLFSLASVHYPHVTRRVSQSQKNLKDVRNREPSKTMKIKQVPLPIQRVLNLSGFYGGQAKPQKVSVAPPSGAAGDGLTVCAISGGNIELKTFCDALDACPA